MRNTAHKVLINSVTDALFIIRLSRITLITFIWGKYRNISAKCLCDKFVSLWNTVTYLCNDYLFTVKTFHRNFCICRNDYAISLCDFRFGKNILCTARTSCFNFNRTTCFFCRFLKSLSSHISMSYTCRTSSYCKYFLIRCSNLFWFSIIFCSFRVIYNWNKFLYRFCINKFLWKIFVHKQNGKFTQYVKVYIFFCIRCGDCKYKLYRLTVYRIKISTVFDYHCRKSGFCHRTAFIMRNCDTLADCRRTFFLSFYQTFYISILIWYFSALFHKVCHCTNGFFFCAWNSVKSDTLFWK